MIRGSTPTYRFEIPILKETIKSVKITFKQGENIVLAKRKDDCTLGDGFISCTLTQEDTFLFDATKCAYIQLRIVTYGGEALTSLIEKTVVRECLDNEVLE